MSREMGTRYWRSLEELAGTPELQRMLEREFPSVAAQWRENGGDGPSRRHFLKLMGASLALGGMTGCRWPKEHIMPASRQPVNRVPGVPVQYATTFELGGVGTGVLVTSYDGRPIKIEGNPKHPFSRGKTNAWMQASVLELYDPDRSHDVLRLVGALRDRPPAGQAPAGQPPAGQTPSGQPSAGRSRAGQTVRHEVRTWAEFEAFAKSHFAGLRANRGAGLGIIAGVSASPTLADMKARLLKEFPEAWWYDHDPLARGSDTGAGERRAHLHLDQADVIVSFDDDFLLMHPVAVKHAADFAGRRRGGAGQLNRLYVAEAGYTVTGAAADHRCALPSGDIPALIFLLARHLFEGGLAGRERAGLPDALTTFDAPHVDSAFAQALARDVLAHRGRGVIAVGPRQPAAVRYLAYVLNVLLENAGKTVTYTAAPALSQPPPSGGGQPFDTLLILGANPVLTAAPDDPILETIASAGTSIHLGLYADETARLCTWHLPQAHYLESWGDARAWDGTVSLVQPLIEPLYGGRTAIEVLALVLGEEQAQGYELVRRTFREQFARGAWEAEWARALHDGVVPDTAWPVESEPSFGQASERDALAAALADAGRRAEPYELRFVPDAKVCDGRFANNAWLQELPDPITKLTWDNAALIAPADAKKLGVEKYGDVVRIEVAGEGGAAPRSLKLPAYILPGHAEGAITLPLGYGRGASAGVVADGAGFDVNKLRSVASPWIVPRAKVTATGKHYDLATTQDHHAIDSQVGERETEKRVAVLVREVTPAELAHDPEHVKHVVHLPQSEQLWQPKKYEGYKWGMAIDLSACIGCGACAVACQAENNVPVVGKEEVARGREMHWLRVDRYFREGTEGRRDEGTEGRRDGGTEGRRDEGTEGDAHLDPSIPRSLDPSVSIVHQPMMCVHCETAPCEGVCPVAATLHDEDGLNVMVYNRCVGTRYCSNNCPYKVRRFNWFYNHHGPAHPRSVKAGTRPLPGLIKRQDATPIEIMQHNPEVTVRSRGVMEKCTYCVQRINAAKIRFKNEHLQGRYPDWPRIPDGAIVPACAQACPTDTIVFGDLNDPNSRVSKLHAEPRSYGVLAELNTRPRTVYLAKVRNPAKQ